jgi:hypothetical protein
MQLTLLDGGQEVTLAARLGPGAGAGAGAGPGPGAGDGAEGESVRIDPEELHRALGWTLEPEGLCRGAVCVPVRDRAALADARGIDLAAFARALDRPLALDVAESAAALGHSAGERSAQLATLEAPDIRLPDLAGRMHSLSEHRGRKVLLIAYASW